MSSWRADLTAWPRYQIPRVRRFRAEGKSVAAIASATGISKRKLLKHWRHR